MTMTTATTLRDQIVDAFSSAKPDAGNVILETRTGGWINLTVEVCEGLSFGGGWWLYTEGGDGSQAVADDLAKQGYAVDAYSGSDTNLTASQEIRERLCEELDCEDDDLENMVADLWATHSDDNAAEDAWLDALRLKALEAVEGMDLSDLVDLPWSDE